MLPGPARLLHGPGVQIDTHDERSSRGFERPRRPARSRPAPEVVQSPRAAGCAQFPDDVPGDAGQLREAEVEELREAGFSDHEVLGIVLAAAYRNFVTRVADMLGVELTDSESAPEEFLQAFGVTREQARDSLYDQVAVQ